MITQYIKSENPESLGASPFGSIGRRLSSGSSSLGATTVEMPMKLEEQLNELESNAVRALLSLGEAFVSQSSFRTPAAKKQADTLSSSRPLQPHQQQQQQPAHAHPNRSVIVKAEPTIVHGAPRNNLQQRNQTVLTTPAVSLTPISIGPTHHSQTQYIQDDKFSCNALNFNNHPAAIKLAPTTASIPTTPPAAPISSTPTNHITSSPISIQPVVSAVSSSSPMISTIFYQIPATAATGSTTTGSQATAVMSPSFTIIPAQSGRAVIPLPMVTAANGSPLVKIEPGTNGGTHHHNGAAVNWSNIQLVKVPRPNMESNVANNGMSAFNGFKTIPAVAPSSTSITPVPSILPNPGKGDGTPLLTTTPPTTASVVVANDGKPPTKSRARRRSQSTTKGQSRSSRVSSGSSELVVSSSVEGLPNIVVDGYEISREIWAKAFLQNDIIHAAGTLFNALFSTEEIKNCTLNGRNGTRQLCPEKRQAIFRIVAWMKNKCQDPYSFTKSPEESKILSREEQMMIEKKVFVERRYQTSRKIRDLPGSSSSSSVPAASTSPPLVTSTTPSAPGTTATNRASPSAPLPQTSTMSFIPSKKCATPQEYPRNPIQQRRNSGSFSSICSSSGGDKAGIPKIALLQSSEIIANYFQSADPLPPPPTASTISAPTGVPLMNNHTHDGPPPMKMQRVGS